MTRSSAKVTAARLGAVGFAAIALGCAALAAFVVGDLLRADYSGTRVVPVVVAASELRAGQPIAADQLALRPWPEDSVPAGAFRSLDEAMAGSDRRTPTVGILPGEPVVRARLASSHEGTGIASLVHANMRAIAVELDDAVGYTALLYPGALVDVIATLRDPLGRGPSARTVVQNARVLSVGTDADVATRKKQPAGSGGLARQREQPGTYVTLEVTPGEAEIVSIARKEGQIDVVLRNATDTGVIETVGATPLELGAFVAPPEEEEADKSERSRRPRTTPRPRRRVQLKASDVPDTRAGARSTGPVKGISTYHAN